MSDAEVSAVEVAYGFRFPPDLRALLQHALPVGRGFPNWRSGPESDLKDRLAWPLEGLRFDVEHNAVWLSGWGARPAPLRDAIARLRRLVAEAPTLVPVYGHRFIPANPWAEGNPVLSVVQSDIIHFGNDLVDCFRRDFLVPPPGWAAKAPRKVRFWNEIIEDNNRPLPAGR